MKATETILFTALPNGVEKRWQPGGALSLSVFISPRLARIPRKPGDDSSTPLSQFLHFQEWPSVAGPIEWEVTFRQPKSGLELTLPAQIVSQPPRRDLWAIFEDAQVRDYRFADYSQYTIHSYPVATLWGLLAEGYQAAAYFNERLAYPAVRLPEAEQARYDFIVESVRDLAISAAGETVISPTNTQLWAALAQVRQDLENALQGQKAVPPDLYGAGWDTRQKRLQALLQFDRFFHRPAQHGLVAPLDVELKRPDFHQMVAALAEYPLLLRQLGLVVDLRIAYHPAIPKNGPATVEVQPAAPAPWGQPAPTCHTLQTRYSLDGNGPAGFRAAEDGSELSKRRLKLGNSSLFNLIEVDVEGAAFKAQVFGVNMVDLDNLRAEGHIGLPALRSGGLSVALSGRALQLHNVLLGAQERNQALEANSSFAGLTAADIQRGYRIDIWDERAGRWFSLCQRTGQYELAGLALQTQDLLANSALNYEEGIVSSAASKAEQEQALYVNEALFHWDGWSLCAPRPGRSIGHEGQLLDAGTQETETAAGPDWLNKNVKIRFRVLPGSLPRLRFGHSYRLRARSVDLAGNSLPPEAGSPLDPSTDAGPVTYLRFEPINPPVVVTSTNARYAKIGAGAPVEPYSDLRQSPGESLDRLVVREPNMMRKGQNPYADWSQRRIAPPECSQLFAEQHGMFDATSKGKQANQLDVEAYRTIVQREGAFLDPQPIEAKEDAHPPQIFSLPYLPDPLAQAVLFFDLPGTLTAQPIEAAPGAGAHWISLQTLDGLYRNILRIDFLPGKQRWPEAQPLRLMLKGAPARSSELPQWNADRRILTVRLARGESCSISTCCVPTDGAKLEWLAAWKWHKDNHPELAEAQLRKQILRGELLMLTPPRSLHLVHAIRKPLETPTFDEPFQQPGILNKSKPGDTGVWLAGTVKVHAPSTAKLDIIAEWNEPRERVEGGLIRGVEQVESRAQVAELPVDSFLGDTVGLGGVFHEFGDTRHRLVRYYAVAATRYREYYDFGQGNAQEGVEQNDWSKNAAAYTRTSQPVTKRILNSARPPAAPLLYVIPAFGWQERRQENHIDRTRRPGGLRVFLEPPWFVTGEDEFLGVVTAQGELNMMNEANFNVMSKLVTTLSNDPTRYPYKYLNQFSFPLEQLPGNALCKNLCPAELWNPDAPSYTPQGCKVNVAAHAVQFDKNRQCYFADIEIDPAGAYFPFVRLALVRFQPYSLPGAQLSPVTLADFVQLTPGRWLSLQYINDNNGNNDNKCKIRVTVSGNASPDPDDFKKTRTVVKVTRSLAMHPDLQDPLMWKVVPVGNDPGQVKITPVPATTTEADIHTYWCGDIELPEAPTTDYPYRLVVLETELHLSAVRLHPWIDVASSLFAANEQFEALVEEQFGALLDQGLMPRTRIVYADSILLGP